MKSILLHWIPVLAVIQISVSKWTEPIGCVQLVGEKSSRTVCKINSSIGNLTPYSLPGEMPVPIHSIGNEDKYEIYIDIHDTDQWYPIVHTTFHTSEPTLPYAVILHDIHVNYYLQFSYWRLEISLCQYRFSLKSNGITQSDWELCSELDQFRAERLAVEQRNVMGESRWFEISLEEVSLVSNDEVTGKVRAMYLMTNYGCPETKVKDVWSSGDTYLNIRLTAVSDQVARPVHPVEYMAVKGVINERDQAIFIENSRIGDHCFGSLLTFCTEMIQPFPTGTDETFSSSGVEIEFQPRVGSAAKPSSWIRLLGVKGFKTVEGSNTEGKSVVGGIQIYFSCLDKPIAAACGENNFKYNLNTKVKLNFELEMSGRWKSKPEIVDALIFWDTGKVVFDWDKLQFAGMKNSGKTEIKSEKADLLKNHISQGNMVASFSDRAFKLDGIQEFVCSDKAECSFTFSSCQPFTAPPDEHYWWLETEKKAFDQFWKSNLGMDKINVTEFEHKGKLGSGTTAEVTLVKYQEKYYAMKTVDLSKVSEMVMERLNNESRILQVLQGKNIPFLVSLKFYAVVNTNAYYVMDFVPGGDFFSFIRAVLEFSEPMARFYIAQLVLALEYLHKMDIAYEDLKPENILIDAQGNIQLVDFGYAERLEGNERTAGIFGTAIYMAPEIFRNGDIGFGKPVDCWALGVLLFELLTGIPPYYKSEQVKNRLKQNPDAKWAFPEKPVLSAEVKSLLKGLLEPNISKRLTMEEIKRHAWFKDINWDKVWKKEVPAPYIPILDPKNMAKHFYNDEETAKVVRIYHKDSRFGEYWKKSTVMEQVQV